MRELCGFFEVFGGRGASSGYEVLGLSKRGKAPTKGKGISRPALVHEAARAHKVIVKKLLDIQKKDAHVPKFKTMVHGDYGAHSLIVVGASKQPVVVKKLTDKQKKALDRYNAIAKNAEKKADAAKKSLVNAVQKSLVLKKGIGKTAGAHVTLKKKKIVMHGLGDGWRDNLPGGGPPYIPPIPPGGGALDPKTQVDDASIQDQVTDEILSDPETLVQSKPVPLDQRVSRLPADAVIYDGQKGWPRYCVGSKKYFELTGNAGEPSAKSPNPNAVGYVWGWDHMNMPNSPDPKRWILRAGHDVFGTASWHDTASGIDPVNPPPYSGSAAGLSNDDFGPLIGNPSMPDFANLRWAPDQQKWFWYPSEAPEYATIEIRNEQALRQKEIDDAAKATADAEKKAQEKIDADRAAEQAQADFQQALAEKAAESEARIEETKRASEQAKYDIEAGRQEQEQAMAERKAALEAEIEERKAALEERRAAIARQQAQPQYDEGAPGYPARAPEPGGYAEEAPGYPAPEPQGYGESDAPPPYAPSGGWDTSLTPGPMPGEGGDDPFAQGGGGEE